MVVGAVRASGIGRRGRRPGDRGDEGGAEGDLRRGEVSGPAQIYADYHAAFPAVADLAEKAKLTKEFLTKIEGEFAPIDYKNFEADIASKYAKNMEYGYDLGKTITKVDLGKLKEKLDSSWHSKLQIAPPDPSIIDVIKGTYPYAAPAKAMYVAVRVGGHTHGTRTLIPESEHRLKHDGRRIDRSDPACVLLIDKSLWDADDTTRAFQIVDALRRSGVLEKEVADV